MFQRVIVYKGYINTSYHVRNIYNVSRLFPTKYYLVPQDGSRSTFWISECNIRPVEENTWNWRI